MFSLQDLIMLNRDFWYWACNVLNCTQLIIFLLSCSRSAFRIVAISVGEYVFNYVVCIRIRPIFSPKLPVHALQCNYPMFFLILQLFVKKPVVLRTYSLDSDRIF